MNLPYHVNCFYPWIPVRAKFSQTYQKIRDVIMNTVASHITSPTIVYSAVSAGDDQRKHQCSASLAFVKKMASNAEMFPFDDVIMNWFGLLSKSNIPCCVKHHIYSNHINEILEMACSGADQRKHQSSASLAFVRGMHRWPVHSPHKGPVTGKRFPFDDVIVPRSNFGMMSLYRSYWE